MTKTLVSKPFIITLSLLITLALAATLWLTQPTHKAEAQSYNSELIAEVEAIGPELLFGSLQEWEAIKSQLLAQEVGLNAQDQTASILGKVANAQASLSIVEVESGAGAPLFLDFPFRLAIDGDLLYATTIGDEALSVFNIADPDNMIHLGSFRGFRGTRDPNAPARPTGVHVRGNAAYIPEINADSFQTVELNFGNIPSSIRRVNTDCVNGFDVTGDANVVVLPCLVDNAVNFLDVSTNPFSPPFPDVKVTFAPRDVELRGNRVFVTKTASNLLVAWDIANLPTVKDDGFFFTPVPNHLPVGIDIEGNFAYLTGIGGGGSITRVDITDTDPDTEDNYAPADGTVDLPFALRAPFDVEAVGDLAFHTSWLGDAFAVSDFSLPTPAVIATLVDPRLDGVQSVVIKGNRAYVAAQNSDSIVAIDISGFLVPPLPDEVLDVCGDISAQLTQAQIDEMNAADAAGDFVVIPAGGEVNDNISLSGSQYLVVDGGAFINGNILGNGNPMILGSGVEVNGSVEGASILYICGPDAEVNGNFEVDTGDLVVLEDAVVTFNGNGDIQNLEIGADGKARFRGNIENVHQSITLAASTLSHALRIDGNLTCDTGTAISQPLSAVVKVGGNANCGTLTVVAHDGGGGGKQLALHLVLLLAGGAFALGLLSSNLRKHRRKPSAK